MRRHGFMRIVVPTLLWALALSAAACTQQAGALSEFVGGPCTADEECDTPPSFCEEGNLFPEGMCSIACKSQEDCILSTVCSARGLCLMRCGADRDCREGYSCIDDERIGGGSEPVCANPL